VTYRLRGFVKGHQKDYTGAVEDLTKFLQTDSTDIEALNTRGYCRGKMNDLRGELDDYRRILKMMPSNMELVKETTYKYLALSDTLSALEILDNYEKAFPTQFDPRLKKIDFYVHIRNWDRALAEIERANEMKLDESNVSTLFLMKGFVYYSQDHFARAAQEFTKATDASLNFRARYLRGKCYLNMGLKQKAKVDFAFLGEFDFSDSVEILKSLQ
jgi:tetratricopeptide (TPR) repeat protein